MKTVCFVILALVACSLIALAVGCTFKDDSAPLGPSNPACDNHVCGFAYCKCAPPSRDASAD